MPLRITQIIMSNDNQFSTEELIKTENDYSSVNNLIKALKIPARTISDAFHFFESKNEKKSVNIPSSIITDAVIYGDTQINGRILDVKIVTQVYEAQSKIKKIKDLGLTQGLVISLYD